ncbi:MAG: hypothetical protein JNJ55_13635 [Betaproteobacteria bacterium]|nr:hypothetical protein [Betaproteobacteria bacterium]
MTFHQSMAALLLALAPHMALAQPATTAPSQGTDAMPVYAMLSLIGDKLEIVIKRFQTGSNISQNLRQPVPIDNPIFDSTAASAAGKSIKQAQPNAELAILNARSAVLFEKQRTLFDERGDKLGVPEAIVNAAKQQGANRLLLVLKRRDDANFLFARSGNYADGGKLEGLGFFVDGTMQVNTYDDKTNERTAAGTGFIAPYVYVEVILLETSSQRVLGRRQVSASRMVGSGRAGQDIGEPWNALSSADKVRHVSQLIEREVTKATLEIVSALK